MTLYEKIQQLCKKNGFEISNLGEHIPGLNITKGSISKWKGGAVPRASTLKCIADYFNVPVSYFEESYGNTEVVRVPVLGNVAAGIPIEAITDIEDYEEITEDMAAKGEYIALKIHGHSMEPKMSEGDVVIVRLQNYVESGDTAIVMVNGGEATCKKIKKTPEGVILISTNPAYDPIIYTAKQIEELPVRILGKVVELRAKF